MNVLSKHDVAAILDTESVYEYSSESEDDPIVDKFWIRPPKIYNYGFSYLARLHRSLAKPPIFDYDQFIEKKVPSETRLKVLLPHDIKKRTNISHQGNTHSRLRKGYFANFKRLHIVAFGNTDKLERDIGEGFDVRNYYGWKELAEVKYVILFQKYRGPEMSTQMARGWTTRYIRLKSM